MGKKIELKKVKLDYIDPAGRKMPGDEFSYKETILGMLQNSLRQEGLSFDEISAALEVIPLLREAEEPGFVVIEDNHWRTIRDKLPQLRFVRVHEELLAFKKAVEDAESVKMTESK